MQAIDYQESAALTRDAGHVLSGNSTTQPKRLQQLVDDAIAVRHYSRRTREAYWHWIKRFVLWSGKRHPRDMGAHEVGQFLTWLASEQHVSASTQRQALAAILFLYQSVLGIEIGWVDNIVRAKQSQRLPVVLTMEETKALLSHTSGPTGLFLRLLYGTGLRLMEGLNLRVKDIDLDQRQIIVRAGKGNKDRVTIAARAESTHQSDDMQASRSALEQIEARGAGDPLPAGLRFYGTIYHGLADYTVTARLGIRLSDKEPTFTLRLVGWDAQQSEIATEIETRVRGDLPTGVQVYTGTSKGNYTA